MKLLPSTWMIGLGLGCVFLTMLACGTGTPEALSATATLIPTETSLPTPTQLSLYLSISLGTLPVQEQGTQSPSYRIDARVPALQDSEDPRATKFNDEMTLLIQQEIGTFKDNLRELAPVPSSNGSTFSENYALLSAPGNILSLKFDILVYIAGGAHPSSHSRSVTYDLQAGSDVSLNELFRPGSAYLQVISDYCLGQLKTRITDLFSSGLDPSASNYQNWNITSNGLLITFDEYQVAAYALGPQQVLIPYSALQTVIDPHGPLASFLP